MNVIGIVEDENEANEIKFIGKIALVGRLSRELGQKAGVKIVQIIK